MSSQTQQAPEKFTYFYSGCFSQWAVSPFIINGILYPTAEHYMMWYKDQVFGGKLEQQILNANHPSVAKELGRQIKGFDVKIWTSVAKQGVFVGNVAKFSQNPLMLHQLMTTYGTTLVEASPTDTVWGIGLDAVDPRAASRSTWLGTNWLGEVLTDVRNAFTLVYRAGDEEFADTYDKVPARV